MSPIVYFVDDSATMREVIKIAFRRESIEVIACASADAAIQQMATTAPDVVITDVIMPEKDGYEVCQYIKQHPQFGRVPVVLMSGVVNRAVAEKAFAVKADELIRKPFQPQDLIARVRHLLQPKAPVTHESAAAAAAAVANASAALSSIFQTPVSTPAGAPRPAQAAKRPPTPPQMPAFTPAAAAAPAQSAGWPAPTAPRAAAAPAPAAQPSNVAPSVPAKTPMPTRSAAPANLPLDVQKMKVEVLRLEGLVRKLQSELEAERQYSRALEEHVKTLQEAE